MAETPPTPPTPSQKVPVSIQDEMRTSYLDYAMSVIIGRAIPDVRDGLKPVHRRILYSAYEQGLLPDGGLPEERDDRRRRARQVPPARRRSPSTTRWSASRRTSRCATRSSTGRATTARSTATRRPRTGTPRRASRSIAVELLADIDKECVDFVPNFDDRLQGADRPAGARARTCSSTARAASPSAWRRTSRRTTWARSSTRRSHLMRNPGRDRSTT